MPCCFKTSREIPLRGKREPDRKERKIGGAGGEGMRTNKAREGKQRKGEEAWELMSHVFVNQDLGKTYNNTRHHISLGSQQQ